mgnify:CR=1 FL=1
MDFDLYLASQSPRRQELLDQLGVRYRVQSANIPEVRRDNESADIFVQRLALEKAAHVWAELDEFESRPVLGADTVVVLNGEIMGKPQSADQGAAMLRALSGQTHQVMTGVALVSQQHSVCVNVSYVRFRVLDDEEIQQYWHTGEPQDKAGGYAIQGYAAAFIENLQGSYSGVMGLPLFETAQLLKEKNITIWNRNQYE